MIGAPCRDIDHLVIGPAGVFVINTKHHANAKITVGTYVVWVNGAQYPYQRKSSQEAQTAQRRLSKAAGFPLTVTPMLAFVRARSLTLSSPPSDLLALRAETVHLALRRLPTTLDLESQDRIYAVARRASTWRF